MNGYHITALRKQRGCLYAVDREGEPTVLIDRKTVDETGLAVGDTVSFDLWEQLLVRSAENRARERALWLLSQRDYSVRELVGKLRTVATREQAEKTVSRLSELGLVDDTRYARRLARELCEVRHLPVRLAARKMAEKGIPREIVSEVLSDFDTDDVAQALAQLEKLCYTDTDCEDARRKLREKLIRKGFSYEAVKQAIRLLEEGEETRCR